MAEEMINTVKGKVMEKFGDLKAAIVMREKLLLRQLDVINQQLQQQEHSDKLTPGIEFFADNEGELLDSIRNFGRFQLTNINLTLQDIYLKNEDYIHPSDDHETMFKGLNQDVVEANEEDECIVVDFSHHKTLMERNARMMNESIINITLKEAKELIKQAKMKRETPVPPLNLEELDDEVESSIADVVSSLEVNSEQFSNNKYSQTQQTTMKQKRFKPKITINNCNGTINLRNIASLTINCSAEENVNAKIPVKYPQTDDGVEEEGEVEEPSSSTKGKEQQSAKSKTLVESLVSSSSNTECTSPTSTSQTTTPNSLSNCSSNNSSRSQSKKQKLKKSHSKVEKSQVENKQLSSISTNHVDKSSSSNDVTCDFYNRLLNEIKKSINHQQKTRTKCSSMDSHGQQQTAAAEADSTSYSQTSSFGGEYTSENPNSRRLLLKNFENLKIILETNSSGDEESFHPVQIEQWLAEIISETDLEPMQNTDILEHSKIHNESQET